MEIHEALADLQGRLGREQAAVRIVHRPDSEAGGLEEVYQFPGGRTHPAEPGRVALHDQGPQPVLAEKPGHASQRSYLSPLDIDLDHVGDLHEVIETAGLDHDRMDVATGPGEPRGRLVAVAGEEDARSVLVRHGERGERDPIAETVAGDVGFEVCTRGGVGLDAHDLRSRRCGSERVVTQKSAHVDEDGPGRGRLREEMGGERLGLAPLEPLQVPAVLDCPAKDQAVDLDGESSGHGRSQSSPAPGPDSTQTCSLQEPGPLVERSQEAPELHGGPYCTAAHCGVPARWSTPVVGSAAEISPPISLTQQAQTVEKGMVRRSFDDRARQLRRRVRRFQALQPVVNKVGLWLWRRDLRRRYRAGTASAHADALISIDPDVIRSQIPLTDLPLDGASVRDVVGWSLGGDWDSRPRPLAEHPVVRGIHERYREGREWGQTSLFAAATQGFAEGRPLWKFRTREDLPRLFSKIDALYASMAAGGYRSQEELGTDRLWDELLVAIDRCGRIHLIDGAHRLAIAQVLGLGSVPALVGVRHSDWDAFRTEVIQYAEDRGVGTYQKLDHPDLAVVPYVHGGARWSLIEPHLDPAPGRALDIGANSGLFSFQLARAGYSVTAVERSEKECYILRRLVAAADADIRVIKGSVLDVPLQPPYKVVLALNIFHHFLKERHNTEKLERLLGGLGAESLFLETHEPEEPQMRGAYFNPAPEEHARWVAERAGLPSHTLIGQPGGRNLFHLSRSRHVDN